MILTLSLCCTTVTTTKAWSWSAHHGEFLRCNRKDSEPYVPIGLLVLNTMSSFCNFQELSVSQSDLLIADTAVVAVAKWSAKQEPSRHHCRVRSSYTCLNVHSCCSSCDSNNQAPSTARGAHETARHATLN